MSSIITRGFGQFELIPTRGYGIGEYVKINWEPDIINVKYAYMTKPKSRVVTFALDKPYTKVVNNLIEKPKSRIVTPVLDKPNAKVVNNLIEKPKSVRSKYKRKNYHIDSY